jgi:hypothetical protein
MNWPRRFTVPFVDSIERFPGRARFVPRFVPFCIALATLLSVSVSGCSTMRRAADDVGDIFRGSSEKSAAGGSAKSDATGRSALPAPSPSRSMGELRLQAAKRLVEANPGITYLGKPPDVLLAIPVITVELHSDGSIRRLEVMRYPGQARDTVEVAMNAIRRAAPFGDVSRLPKPWKFNETFLFNDQRKFKPMTLDQ